MFTMSFHYIQYNPTKANSAKDSMTSNLEALIRLTVVSFRTAFIYTKRVCL